MSRSSSKLGHYRIIRALGKGGMGEVYLADDTKLKREVAVKVLPASLRDDSERLRLFRREAEAAARLKHPSIATIHALEELESPDADGEACQDASAQQGRLLGLIGKRRFGVSSCAGSAGSSHGLGASWTLNSVGIHPFALGTDEKIPTPWGQLPTAANKKGRFVNDL